MRYRLMCVAATLCLSTSAASAATYGFTCITSGLPCTTIGNADQLQVDITNPSGAAVRFFFTNAGGIDTSVRNIYWDSSLLSYSSPTIVNGSGTSFVANGNPGNLPAGETLAPPFASDFNVSATPPPPVDGINAGENLAVTLSLAPNVTFQQLLASIGGETRIGLNIAAVGGSLVIDGSPTVIPVPAALPLMFAGLVGLCFVARRRSA